MQLVKALPLARASAIWHRALPAGKERLSLKLQGSTGLHSVALTESHGVDHNASGRSLGQEPLVEPRLRQPLDTYRPHLLDVHTQPASGDAAVLGR